MSSDFSLLIFLSIVMLTNSLHFLGGFFSYRHVHRATNDVTLRMLLVELRFHVFDPVFRCTPDRINKHMIVYLSTEAVPFDNQTKNYRWNETTAVEANRQYYDIHCFTDRLNPACDNLQQRMWGYCESVNDHSGYSTVARRFLLPVHQSEMIRLYYVRMEN